MSAFVEKDGRHGRSYKMTTERLSRIQKLLNKGESNNSIARQVGISEGSILYMIKQGQLKKRKKARLKAKMYALIEVHFDKGLDQVSKPYGIDGGFSLASLEMACIFNCVHSAMAKYEGKGLFVVPLTRLTLSGLNICG